MRSALNTARSTKRLHSPARIGILLLLASSLRAQGRGTTGRKRVQHGRFLRSTIGLAADLEFGLLFKDAKGLEPGYNLMYRGLRVGTVRDVGLDPDGQVLVQVSVPEEFRGSVYREADFIIERSGAQITMRDRTGSRTPIRAGDVLAGSGTLDHILGRLGEGLYRAGEVSAAGVVALTDRIEARLASSPAAQDLLRAMQEFAQKLPLPGKPEFKQFVERWVPQLRALGQRYMRELEQNGLATAAQTFWKDFASWLAELVPPPTR